MAKNIERSKGGSSEELISKKRQSGFGIKINNNIAGISRNHQQELFP